MAHCAVNWERTRLQVHQAALSHAEAQRAQQAWRTGTARVRALRKLVRRLCRSQRCRCATGCVGRVESTRALAASSFLMCSVTHPCTPVLFASAWVACARAD